MAQQSPPDKSIPARETADRLELASHEATGQPIDAASHSVGRHLLANLHGVPVACCCDEKRLMQLLIAALREAGFTIIDSLSHKFPGTDAGVTGMVLLSESHAAMHTYPEYNLIALDVFSCGPPDPTDVLENLILSLQPKRVEKSVHTR